MTPTTFDRKALLQTILDQFRLDRDGDHGPAHWARVRKHAMTIGRARGADMLVVELFSFLHDSQRENEFTDTDHGERAAAYAASLNHSHYSLTGSQLDKLCQPYATTAEYGYIRTRPFSLAGTAINSILGE
jgi:uncharacterized protein